MSLKQEIQLTADGSSTIYLPEIDEHYHSVKGALTESRHVYISEGLCHRLKSAVTLPASQPCRVLEIGFGTGLNAVLTAIKAQELTTPVHYINLELFPVDTATAMQLSYGKATDPDMFRAIHAAQWNLPAAINPYFTIEKRIADFTHDPLPDNIDVIYMDAFAPEKQPEMWSNEAISRLAAVMSPGCVLTTYCAKGAIRRLFQSCGLIVERIPGPPGGKREILRAVKPHLA